MRVIAGKYKRRSLQTIKAKTTRPTTDRNKENIFNIIGPFFDGGTVLDLFAGSGGLGIEAISRGCEYLYSVDIQYSAYKVIQENIQNLEIENALVWKMDYKKALYTLNEEGITFDLIFLDPPYGKKMIDGILEYLIEHAMLNEGCMIVIEEAKEEEFINIPTLQLRKRNVYGITAITILQYYSEGNT